MNKVHLYYVVTGTTYDSAFSASLALRFNACPQLAHMISHIESLYLASISKKVLIYCLKIYVCIKYLSPDTCGTQEKRVGCYVPILTRCP